MGFLFNRKKTRVIRVANRVHGVKIFDNQKDARKYVSQFGGVISGDESR